MVRKPTGVISEKKQHPNSLASQINGLPPGDVAEVAGTIGSLLFMTSEHRAVC